MKGSDFVREKYLMTVYLLFNTHNEPPLLPKPSPSSFFEELKMGRVKKLRRKESLEEEPFQTLFLTSVTGEL